MSQWFVYMLRCCDGSLYTGITTDLEKRVQTHNKGDGAAYTRSRLPVVVVWSEAVESESAARKREYQIKNMPRAVKLGLIK
jgi:putative endonuclease